MVKGQDVTDVSMMCKVESRDTCKHDFVSSFLQHLSFRKLNDCGYLADLFLLRGHSGCTHYGKELSFAYKFPSVIGK